MKRTPIQLAILTALQLVAFALPARAADDEFFENRIRPALVKYCYECHSSKAKSIKGGLVLDSRVGWQKGGDTGPAISPGQPDKSLLAEAIGWQNVDLQMPPDKRLPESVIKDIRKWIKDGAKDPRTSKHVQRDTFDLRKRKESHWAWQPIVQPDKPATIDSFIAKRLADVKLTAAPRATNGAIIRRLSFALTGLPPDMQDLQRTDFEAYVNQLISSKHFGEHWARHWLDVVRFCETKGHVTDQERPFAWKYRDYVIQAFNDDLPYDRFVAEHLAGDLLPENAQRAGPHGESNVTPIATGFLFMHEMHFMSVDPVRQRWDEINAQLEVVGKAFLGLTLDCARCHDHKFDAISQRDYYALAGIFYSTEQGRKRTAQRAKQLSAETKKEEKAYRQFLDKQIACRRTAQKPKVAGDYFPISEELGIQAPTHTKKLFTHMQKLQQLDPNWQHWTRAAIDAKQIQDVHLLVRGEYRNPGKIVPRGFLEAIPSSRPFPKAGSGRLWLAEQITHKQNPLTARVWVNRIWHHLFSAGIVSTPNNFGTQGSRPTHPELLDYLASRLIESSWSTKAIVKEIVLSETFLRSSTASETALKLDPTNKWLSHQNRHRLTAEQIRDAMLAVSDQLNTKMGGPSVDCYVPPYATANKPSNVPKSGPLDGNGRRSVYLKVRRNFYDPFLMTFDFPDRGKPVGKRNVTIVPSQALAMLNSPLVHRLAKGWAPKLSDIPKAFQQAIGRSPTAEELKAFEQLLKRDSGAYHVAHLLFNHPEFLWLQ